MPSRCPPRIIFLIELPFSSLIISSAPFFSWIPTYLKTNTIFVRGKWNGNLNVKWNPIKIEPFNQIPLLNPVPEIFPCSLKCLFESCYSPRTLLISSGLVIILNKVNIFESISALLDMFILLPLMSHSKQYVLCPTLYLGYKCCISAC